MPLGISRYLYWDCWRICALVLHDGRCHIGNFFTVRWPLAAKGWMHSSRKLWLGCLLSVNIILIITASYEYVWFVIKNCCDDFVYPCILSFCSVCRLQRYHVENTGSHPITELKQRRAWLVLGWVTSWEYGALSMYTFNSSLSPSHTHVHIFNPIFPVKSCLFFCMHLVY